MDYCKYKDYLESLPKDKLEEFKKTKSPQRIEWLSQKVNKDGSFREFFGDTTVLPIIPTDITKIQDIQGLLMEKLGDFFAETIIASTFHITTHDLNNGNNYETLREKIDTTEAKVRSIFNKLKRKYKGHSINFVSTNIYHSITSICLGFAPSSKNDFDILMDIDSSLEEIVPLNRTLTPHITLFYYQLREFSLKEEDKLIEFLENNKGLDIKLSIDFEQLSYEHFTSMNSYKSIFKVGDCNG